MTNPLSQPGRPDQPGGQPTAEQNASRQSTAQSGPTFGQNRRLQEQVDSLTDKNSALVAALEQARNQLVALKGQVESLAAPPSTYGLVLREPDTSRPENRVVDIFTAGRRMLVAVSPEVDLGELTAGVEVRLNDALAVVEATAYDDLGQVVVVHESLGADRVVVVMPGEEHRVVRRSAALRDATLRQGDLVLIDTRSGFAFEVVPKAEVEDMILEEVPDISYSDIGGLTHQIEAIRDNVELPYLHPELYREYHLRPPKGVLLYGPPGCGKTLIAKAVAASLARQVAARRTAGDDAATAGASTGGDATGAVPNENSSADTSTADNAPAGDAPKSYFLNVKGPELLNKYVGESERQIRLIFQRAREHASSGAPVVVFFDEMDSLFRTRGSGLSSDVETTIVPQLLAEIDGVERLDNVIVIGASNREDMIDPAILRPGRLDAKIRIDRPDRAAAIDIFGKYLTADLPVHADELAAHGGSRQAAVGAMIAAVTERMYARIPENEFLAVDTADGRTEILSYADFASGAMIHNIVDRAKRAAIKRVLDGGEPGLRTQMLLDAARTEFVENEDLHDITDPEHWMRVSGRRGPRVLGVRRLTGQRGSETSTGADETIEASTSPGVGGAAVGASAPAVREVRVDSDLL